MPRVRVCVVGAGVSGLSTSYVLLTEYPAEQFEVTVVADRFTPDTTSDVAFGLWEPFLLGKTPAHKVQKWGHETLDHMVELANSKDASKAGTFVLTGHSIFKETKPEDPPWRLNAVDFRHLTDKELRTLYPGYRYGWCWTTAASECKFYLPYLTDKITQLGGKFHKRRISSLSELYGQYDVIVNCTGLGAKSLIQDEHLQPIRGQVVRVRAPWVKRFIMDDENDSYIIPGQDTVILGGSHEEGNWSTTVSPSTKSRILKHCQKLMPSLQNAEFVRDAVGLRPGRTEVRVEAEVARVNHAGREIKQNIVHNYGHGGSGIGLHWGCAKEAAQLVLKAATPDHKL